MKRPCDSFQFQYFNPLQPSQFFDVLGPRHHYPDRAYFGAMKCFLTNENEECNTRCNNNIYKTILRTS